MARVLFAALLSLLLTPRGASASLMSPETEDTVAGFLAVVILFVVPVTLIVLFWLVHILPEKIAHNRHHPQFEAIRTLCLLSLVFGGLLWPLAWIWAYTKPVLHKLAYGTDRDVAADHAGDGWDEPRKAGTPRTLRERLARLEERGVPASELTPLRDQIEALEAKFAEGDAR